MNNTQEEFDGIALGEMSLAEITAQHNKIDKEIDRTSRNPAHCISVHEDLSVMKLRRLALKEEIAWRKQQELA